ncbi:MAG: hypothetical protein WA144_15570 [Candidatus Methanoperedens sp.]
MKVLIACEFSGVVREAFKARGHDVWSCDLLPSEIPGQHIQDDVLKYLNKGWDLMIAHPECTFLTVSGNRWMKPEYQMKFPDRPQQRKKAIEFFMKIVNAPIDKICVENPVGIMSTLYRKPEQIIQPYQFGHKEPKKTCLWLKNLPLLQPTKLVEPEYFISKSGKRLASWYYLPSNTPERKKLRQRTFTGIAESMANQWG